MSWEDLVKELGDVYLGDDVYAGHNGYQFWLKTSDGIRVTNQEDEPAVAVETVSKVLDLMEALRDSNKDP